MNKGSLYFFLAVAISLCLSFPPVFSQGADNPAAGLTKDSVASAVKEAIKETDREREAKHAQLASELKAKLNLAVQDWVNFLKRGKRLELNKLRYETWDLGGKINFPVPYNYYLRDFFYTIVNLDIRADSLISGYKGAAQVRERLHIEEPHNSSADDASKFFYTLSRVINLSLEYRQDRFVVTGVTYEPFLIEHNWQGD
jgi:hypothetical protein